MEKGGNEEFHSLYRSPNIVRDIKFRRIRLAGHVARMEEESSAFRTKRSLGRPRSRWQENIRWIFKK